jgi:LmbE family N-acetylglucosaminyl deacetylase
MSKPAFPPLSPKVVLGVAAHPDDLDFFSGGTMAAFAKAGAEVYYIILTDGGKGTSDRSLTPEKLRDIRREEQRKAAKILGVKDIFFCDYPDGTLENTLDVKRDVVRAIRRVKPDVVVAMDPTEVYVAHQGLVNHPDHRAAGQAALDAVYPLARDHLTFPELADEGLEPHNVATLLLIRMEAAAANYAMDVSELMDLKFEALAAHSSQFGDLDFMYNWSREICSAAGEPYGYKYGEPFVRIDIK